MPRRQVSVTRTIPPSAPQIFALPTDPVQHPLLDGSGTVRAARACGPRRLEPGSRFAMDMRVGVPYRLTTTVVEYEQNRLIAWRHFFGHRWRWELDPDGDGRTAVTETFDWSTTRLPFLLDRTPLPTRNRAGIERTLERLAGTFGDTRPNGTRSAAPARRFRRRSRCPCRR